MAYVLGVDLGTTYTAAATFAAGADQPTVLPLGNRALQIPSVLYRQSDGSFLVGESAVRRGQTDPRNLVREFKRRIGDPVPIVVGGSPYSAATLTARLLSWVVEQSTIRLGAPPYAVMLTHPANWTDFKLDILRQAADLADLPGPRMTCPEPQAAAYEYAAHTRVRAGERICVYDLGGGTFDAAVLELTPGGFTLVGTPDGIEHLGGVDFDQAIVEWVMAQLTATSRVTDPLSIEALTRLRVDCTEAKEALSVETETEVPISLPGAPPTSVRLTRSDFEEMIRPAIADTLRAIDRALRSAGVSEAELAAFVLVGGSSRIPLVAELLSARYGRVVAGDTHPKHDVALGAARAARQLVEAASSTRPRTALSAPTPAAPAVVPHPVGPPPQPHQQNVGAPVAPPAPWVPPVAPPVTGGFAPAVPGGFAPPVTGGFAPPGPRPDLPQPRLPAAAVHSPNPGQRRGIRAPDGRLIAAVAALVVIAIVTAIALTLRGGNSDGTASLPVTSTSSQLAATVSSDSAESETTASSPSVTPTTSADQTTETTVPLVVTTPSSSTAEPPPTTTAPRAPTVSGHVWDPAGHPLSGMTVEFAIYPPCPGVCQQAFVETDANGAYSIDLPDGWYRPVCLNMNSFDYDCGPRGWDGTSSNLLQVPPASRVMDFIMCPIADSPGCFQS